MYLVVGLGNPGRTYERNRHNAGFRALDALHRRAGLAEFREKFSGAWAVGEVFGAPAALLKPGTFMNLSGESVQPAAAFLKIPASRILVVHDEIDLPWRDVRVKIGGGHAGHNGLRSIVQHLGTNDFARVRLGVGRPPEGFAGDVARWVLSDFDPAEEAEWAALETRALDAIRSVLDPPRRPRSPGR